MSGEGFYAEQMEALFKVAHLRAGFPCDVRPLSAAAFRVPKVPGAQMELF